MAIQRIESFLANVAKTVNEVDIATLCEKELVYLRNEYNVQDIPDIDGKYAGLATYKGAISSYRKALYVIDHNHLARKYLKLSLQDSANIKYQNGKSSMKNYKNRMNGDIFSIENPNDYIKTSIELLSARSYIDNILGLAALTGRRVNEIGYSCDFEACDYDEVYNVYHLFDEIMDIEALDMVNVYGLSKKQTYLHDKAGSDTGVIPVLCDYKIILESLSDLRKVKSFSSATDFHNKASKELSKKVKKAYADFSGVTTSHDLRKAYVRLAYDAMINENVSENDGLQTFAEFCLQQKIPDNYMKFS